MKKFLGLFLSLALTLSMFSGFALAEETDLSSLTFGNGWKIDTSKEYVGDQYKRFDGLEFTRIVNTSGFDLPEGMTIDDNDRVWMFTLITGLQPRRCGLRRATLSTRRRALPSPAAKSRI